MSEARVPVAGAMMAPAFVTTGEIETNYWRAGCGPAVLLLVDEARDTQRQIAAFAALAPRARVFVPDQLTIAALTCPRASHESPFSRWLRFFLEGLGIPPVRVVARIGLAHELFTFAAANPGLLSSVLLLGGGALSGYPDGLAVRALPADASWEEIANVVMPSREQGGSTALG
ncbi:MAG: hypothetical protein ABIZ91_09490 [Gemmatimonadaceae bacterium]